jgi:hypothetical protein
MAVLLGIDPRPFLYEFFELLISRLIVVKWKCPVVSGRAFDLRNLRNLQSALNLSNPRNHLIFISFGRNCCFFFNVIFKTPNS